MPVAGLEAQARDGSSRVRIGGTVVNVKHRPTRTGGRMAWVRLSDATATTEVTCFSEVLARAGDLLRDGSMILATVDLRTEGETLRITAQDIAALDEAAAGAGAGIRVWLRETGAVAHIRALLGRERGGKGRIVLVPCLDAARSVEIALPGHFNVSPRLAQALKVVPGVERIEEL